MGAEVRIGVLVLCRRRSRRGWCRYWDPYEHQKLKFVQRLWPANDQLLSFTSPATVSISSHLYFYSSVFLPCFVTALYAFRPSRQRCIYCTLSLLSGMILLPVMLRL